MISHGAAKRMLSTQQRVIMDRRPTRETKYDARNDDGQVAVEDTMDLASCAVDGGNAIDSNRPGLIAV